MYVPRCLPVFPQTDTQVSSFIVFVLQLECYSLPRYFTYDQELSLGILQHKCKISSQKLSGVRTVTNICHGNQRLSIVGFQNGSEVDFIFKRCVVQLVKLTGYSKSVNSLHVNTVGDGGRALESKMGVSSQGRLKQALMPG